MATQKTTVTTASVTEFIDRACINDQQCKDSYALLTMMKTISGQEARMWGPSIIGFGQYHYRYASGHTGNAPLLGFSPRKSAISLYVFTGAPEHEHLLEGLGKFKRGKACLYISKLSDINEDKLAVVMKTTIDHLQKMYG